MLFYVSLFLVCFIVAAITIWAYRAIVHSTRHHYRAILPSAKDSRVRGIEAARRRQAFRDGQEVKTPWGWKKPANFTAAREPVFAAATGGSRSNNVGWPYRKEPFEVVSGRNLGAAEPGRKVVGVRRVQKGGVDKPWGW